MYLILLIIAAIVIGGGASIVIGIFAHPCLGGLTALIFLHMALTELTES